jgi:hypothetical protein
MPKVVITAQVQDGVKWEANFRTHGDVFKTYNLRAPIQYTVAGNEVAICMEPGNADAFMKTLETQATIDAMTFDGVKRETVKTHVLDKEMKV